MFDGGIVDWSSRSLTNPLVPPPELFEQVKLEKESDPKIVYLAVSSDGGLCGGIHSSISRYIKNELKQHPADLAIVGDKPKAQLARTLSQNIKVSFNGVGKDVPTFAEACAIADEIGKLEQDWDEVRLLIPRRGAWVLNRPTDPDHLQPLHFCPLIRGETCQRHFLERSRRVTRNGSLRDGG